MTTIPILLYHSVNPRPPDRIAGYAVDPTTFASHLDLLMERGYSPLTVSGLCDAVDSGRVPPRPAVVTVDDGWADVHTYALPALAARQMPATIYLTTGSVGADREFLSWAQVVELTSAGMEIGSHGHTHLQLDVVPHATVVDELHRARAELQARLDLPVRSFAYPHGYFDGWVRDTARLVGHDSACAVKQALSAPGDDRMALARLMVRPTTDASRLARWLDGHRVGIVPSPARVQIVAWRTCRRLRARASR